MAKQIKIDVDEKIPRLDFDKIEPLQGQLKSLSETAFEKLKGSILKRGFFVPLFVWTNGKKIKLLDGHQRVRVLGQLKEEGFTIPKIPCVALSAKNEKEAKEKLLAITSAYGKFEKEGLYEFLQGMDEKLIVDDFDLSGLDGLKFLDEFYNESAIDPLPPVKGDLGDVGGNGVKMLQLFFTEEQHGQVLALIQALQKKYETENATDTVLMALKDANN